MGERRAISPWPYRRHRSWAKYSTTWDGINSPGVRRNGKLRVKKKYEPVSGKTTPERLHQECRELKIYSRSGIGLVPVGRFHLVLPDACSSDFIRVGRSPPK